MSDSLEERNPRGYPEAAVYHAPPEFEHLCIGAYACDAAGNLRWFNRRAGELWGRNPAIGEGGDRFCGSFRLFDLGGGVLRHEDCPMAEALHTGEPIKGREIVVERPDGARVISMAHVSPVRDGMGNLIGAVNCFHPIHDHHNEMRVAEQREQLFRDVIEALPAAIYMTDVEGRITLYNEAAVELSGRRPELGSDSWCVSWRLFQPDGTPLPHDECPMAIALKEDRAIRGEEAVLERPDGSRVAFLPFPTPLHDAQGRLVGAVNMLVDIRHRQEAETQQQVLLAELVHRVKNNIQMLHSLLRVSAREAANDDSRAVLTDAATRMTAMAAAHSTLYRADRTNSFSVDELVEAVSEAAAATLGADIAFDGRAEDVHLDNDAAAPLALILNELITNASKYGKNGDAPAVIRVSVERDGDEIICRVADSGPGFAFHPGSEAGGLGLELVQGLVGQLRGRFAVEDRGGACCIVSFPER